MHPITTVRRFHCRAQPTIFKALPRHENLDEFYQNRAGKFWDNFYKRHKNKFFKDRHYLDKDWGRYFSDDAHSPNGKVVLEVGCGAGNTVFPLLAAYPKLYVHACDISPHAIQLVKSHVEFREERINAFVCDIAAANLHEIVHPSSVDVITMKLFMLFVLSEQFQ
uniref:Methyltransferase -like isoform X1 n=1 Tax=Bixa orellana TaxID=66672 RepID=A0A9Y1EIB2_BIXOR|nr:putative methyltransferase -like isoform X1 [Bixa orellana]